MPQSSGILCGSDVGSRFESMARAVEDAASLLRKTFVDSRSSGLHMEGLRDRVRWIKDLRRAVERRRADIERTISQERGVSEHSVYMNDYVPAILMLAEHEKSAKKILADENRSRFSPLFINKKGIVRHEPLGVIGVISPFNYPFSLPLGHIVSALLSGNAVLWKPSERTPRTNALLASIIRDSFSSANMCEGLFSVLPEDREYGEPLVRSPSVDRIAFTGSVAVGHAIARANAEVRPCMPPILELGGSNAALVLDDANLENAVAVITWSRCANGGQSCNAIKRAFVTQRNYEPFLSRLVVLMKGVDDRETMRNRFAVGEGRQFDVMIRDAVQCGARIFHSRSPEFIDDRPYPVVLAFDSFNPQARVLAEETFVPILAVVKVRDAEEAITFANRSQFGLGASVFTNDREALAYCEAMLQCGSVNHNDAMTEFAQMQLPFGGFKNSGFGRSHGPEGLLEFTQPKTMIRERFSAPNPALYPWTEKRMQAARRMLRIFGGIK